jgi:hypothetical protein
MATYDVLRCLRQEEAVEINIFFVLGFRYLLAQRRATE